MREDVASNTAEQDSWRFLQSLWSDEELNGAVCCECYKPIDIEKAFARTLQLDKLETKRAWAKEIEVPSLNTTIRTFHRHLQCLYDTMPFVAVSHVWEPAISDVQYRRLEAKHSPCEAEDLVRLLPESILLALESDAPRQTMEVWHDYISVTQWTKQLKSGIILEIPELFKRAQMTVVYLSDLEASVFEEMRFGPTAVERCRAMGRICSATWFSRMWTTAELCVSHELRILAKGFKLAELDPEDRPLTHELWGRWQDEVGAHGIARDLENEVYKDGNLVPWKLGTIIAVRLDALAGRRTCFGVVHAVLTKRRVAVPTDFFYAFENVLKTKVPLGAIRDDPKALLHRMAISRIVDQNQIDLSPLFMVPTKAETGFQMESGYVDHYTWGLGVEEAKPTNAARPRRRGPDRTRSSSRLKKLVCSDL